MTDISGALGAMFLRMANPCHPSQKQPGRSSQPKHNIGQIDPEIRVKPREGSGSEKKDECDDSGPHDRNPICPDHRRTPLLLTRNIDADRPVSSPFGAAR